MSYLTLRAETGCCARHLVSGDNGGSSIPRTRPLLGRSGASMVGSRRCSIGRLGGPHARPPGRGVK
jgi:hypothetical protein